MLPGEIPEAQTLAVQLGRSFPTREQLQAAVAVIPTTTDHEWRKRQGPRYRLEFSPGSVRVTATDYARASKTADAAAERRLRQTADVLAHDAQLAAIAKAKGKRGETSLDWSMRSRARMTLRFATVDYSTMFDQGVLAALVTFSYPLEWHRLVPTPKAFKAHVSAFRVRYANTWGGRERQWAGIWKMEFQGRGAPHLHVGTVIPQGVQRAPLSIGDLEHLESCQLATCTDYSHTGMFPFREWAKRVWSYIVFKDQAPPIPYSAEGWDFEREKHQRQGVHVDVDEGFRYSDPKRVGIYFAKHGLWDKEYQNHAPELWKVANDGGANFWGYWVVRPLIVSKETHEALIMHIMSASNRTMCRFRT